MPPAQQRISRSKRVRPVSPKRSTTDPVKQTPKQTPRTAKRSNTTGATRTPGNTRAYSPKRSSNSDVKATRTAAPSIMENLSLNILGTGHYDNAQFEAAVKRCIPAEFTLIASQDDKSQAQESFYAMDQFKLTKHVPKYVAKSNAGSCATSALLQIMYETPHKLVAHNLKRGEEPLNVLEVSQRIQKLVKDATKLTARPTISSSRPLGPPRKERGEYAPFFIVPPNYNRGTRRALLIGVINGVGPDLKGPPNDVKNIQDFLEKHCGFERKNITVLADYWNQNAATQSTKKNILAGFQKMVQISKPGDVCFVQFTGHGGRVGNQLYINPSDYQKGQISDETIMRELIKAMPGGTYTTLLVDCCYSGTVADLPYVLAHNKMKQQIDSYYDTDMRKEMLRKEKELGEEYQRYKEARAERRLMGRLADVAAAASEAATYAAETVATAAAMPFVAAGDAATYAADSAAQAYRRTGTNMAEAYRRTGTNMALAGETAAATAAGMAKGVTEAGTFVVSAPLGVAKGVTEAGTFVASALTPTFTAPTFTAPTFTAPSFGNQDGGEQRSVFRRTNTSADGGEARAMFRRTNTSADGGEARSMFKRSNTSADGGETRSMFRRSDTNEGGATPFRRTGTNTIMGAYQQRQAALAEERDRKAALERSRREAREARAARLGTTIEEEERKSSTPARSFTPTFMRSRTSDAGSSPNNPRSSKNSGPRLGLVERMKLAMEGEAAAKAAEIERFNREAQAKRLAEGCTGADVHGAMENLEHESEAKREALLRAAREAQQSRFARDAHRGDVHDVAENMEHESAAKREALHRAAREMQKSRFARDAHRGEVSNLASDFDNSSDLQASEGYSLGDIKKRRMTAINRMLAEDEEVEKRESVGLSAQASKGYSMGDINKRRMTAINRLLAEDEEMEKRDSVGLSEQASRGYSMGDINKRRMTAINRMLAEDEEMEKRESGAMFEQAADEYSLGPINKRRMTFINRLLAEDEEEEEAQKRESGAMFEQASDGYSLGPMSKRRFTAINRMLAEDEEVEEEIRRTSEGADGPTPNRTAGRKRKSVVDLVSAFESESVQDNRERITRRTSTFKEVPVKPRKSVLLAKLAFEKGGVDDEDDFHDAVERMSMMPGNRSRASSTVSWATAMGSFDESEENLEDSISDLDLLTQDNTANNSGHSKEPGKSTGTWAAALAAEAAEFDDSEANLESSISDLDLITKGNTMNNSGHSKRPGKSTGTWAAALAAEAAEFDESEADLEGSSTNFDVDFVVGEESVPTPSQNTGSRKSRVSFALPSARENRGRTSTVSWATAVEPEEDLFDASDSNLDDSTSNHDADYVMSGDQTPSKSKQSRKSRVSFAISSIKEEESAAPAPGSPRKGRMSVLNMALAFEIPKEDDEDHSSQYEDAVERHSSGSRSRASTVSWATALDSDLPTLDESANESIPEDASVSYEGDFGKATTRTESTTATPNKRISKVSFVMPAKDSKEKAGTRKSREVPVKPRNSVLNMALAFDTPKGRNNDTSKHADVAEELSELPEARESAATWATALQAEAADFDDESQSSLSSADLSDAYADLMEAQEEPQVLSKEIPSPISEHTEMEDAKSSIGDVGARLAQKQRLAKKEEDTLKQAQFEALEKKKHKYLQSRLVESAKDIEREKAAHEKRQQEYQAKQAEEKAKKEAEIAEKQRKRKAYEERRDRRSANQQNSGSYMPPEPLSSLSKDAEREEAVAAPEPEPEKESSNHSSEANPDPGFRGPRRLTFINKILEEDAKSESTGQEKEKPSAATEPAEDPGFRGPRRMTWINKMLDEDEAAKEKEKEAPSAAAEPTEDPGFRGPRRMTYINKMLDEDEAAKTEGQNAPSTAEPTEGPSFRGPRKLSLINRMLEEDAAAEAQAEAEKPRRLSLISRMMEEDAAAEAEAKSQAEVPEPTAKPRRMTRINKMLEEDAKGEAEAEAEKPRRLSLINRMLEEDEAAEAQQQAETTNATEKPRRMTLINRMLAEDAEEEEARKKAAEDEARKKAANKSRLEAAKKRISGRKAGVNNGSSKPDSTTLRKSPAVKRNSIMDRAKAFESKAPANEFRDDATTETDDLSSSNSSHEEPRRVSAGRPKVIGRNPRTSGTAAASTARAATPKTTQVRGRTSATNPKVVQRSPRTSPTAAASTARAAVPKTTQVRVRKPATNAATTAEPAKTTVKVRTSRDNNNKTGGYNRSRPRMPGNTTRGGGARMPGNTARGGGPSRLKIIKSTTTSSGGA